MGPSTPNPLIAAYLEKRPALVRFFTLRIGSSEAAEDLVQDLYVKISAMDAEGVAQVRSPVAFLYRLGSNLMLDRMRQARRSRARDDAWRGLETTSLGGEDIVDQTAADDALAAKQRLDRVVRVLETLPPARRRAFRLHKLEGLSHAQTAAIMGISVSAVEKHISAALKRLMQERDE